MRRFSLNVQVNVVQWAANNDLTLTNMHIIFVSKDYFVVLTVFAAIYC